MKVLKSWLCLGLLVLSVTACGFKGRQIPRKTPAVLPLFDAHFHYNQPADEDELLASLSAAHITRSVLFGGESASEMARKYPERFVASYSGLLSGRRHELNGGKDEAIVTEIAGEVDQALRSGRYRGLGEISAYHHAYPHDPVAPDSPLILRLFELAGRYHVPVNIHCSDFGYSEMEHALRESPGTTVIWAHTGSHLPPDKIRILLQAFPNLYFDLAAMDDYWPGRHTLLSFFGGIAERWRGLFEEFPDRFEVGFDLSTDINRGRRISTAAVHAAAIEQALAGLTPATAKKIAYENAERLYQVR
jgi:hypothetical protein